MPICPKCHKRFLLINMSKGGMVECPNCRENLASQDLFKIPDVFFMRFWFLMPRWLKIVISISFWIGAFFMLPVIGSFFRNYFHLITITWLSLPIVLLIACWAKLYKVFEYSWALVLRKFIVSLEAIISFMVFFSFMVGDAVWKDFLFLDSTIAWLLEWVLFILLFALPILCWIICSKFISKMRLGDLLHT